MATTNLTTQTTTGLSNAELDAELLNELPEREEMSGCHRWYNCWHPCYEFSSPCYDYSSFHSSSTFVTSYSNTTSFGQFIR
jgi:hypothetical protein